VGIVGSKIAYPWKVSSFGIYMESIGVERTMVDDDARAEPLDLRHRTG
jgi:hypothetical protein